MQNIEQKIIEIHFNYVIINKIHMIRISDNDFWNVFNRMKKNKFHYRMQCYSMFKMIIFINFTDIQATTRFINNKFWKIEDHKFYDFRKSNIIDIKNKIARNRKSNASKDDIEKSQQTIKFFNLLLFECAIHWRLINFWNLEPLLSLLFIKKKIRKFSFSIMYFVYYNIFVDDWKTINL